MPGGSVKQRTHLFEELKDTGPSDGRRLTEDSEWDGSAGIAPFYTLEEVVVVVFCVKSTFVSEYNIFRQKSDFPSGNFPKVFSQVATSQMCNFPSGNFPN